ncbi:MAG: hypothetical protein H6Q07_520 [Acidobacteria bacterium]|nr:hypothetical protein [Acidobacteriota bacterium]
MIFTTLIAAFLAAVTVAVHAAGFSLILRFLIKRSSALPIQMWPVVWLLIRVTLWLILIHLAEIAIWGGFYLWGGCLPDVESAFYFSGVTFTTVGYGDLVLARPWRILCPIEAVTGSLMSGLSAALFFAILSRLYMWRFQTKPK